MTLRTKRWLQVAINLAVVVVLLFAVSFLPPDTSLADRRRAGVLKLCVPPSYPPLVSGDPTKPGFDVELVSAIATQMGLKLLVNTVSSIGSDFNPRNWSLTRGQCDVVAGGVADTAQTRSFLETIPTPAETGWVGISATGRLPDANGNVAVLPGTSGLDRLQLSGWLREKALRVVPTRTPQQFADALASGRADAGITERFVAATLNLGTDRALFWLPEDRFAHYRMALGLWKGDQTLKRAIETAIAALNSSDEIAALAARYGLDDAVTPYP